MNRGSNSVWGRGREVILGITMLISFIIPHTSTFLLSLNPLMCLLLFSTRKTKSVLPFGILLVLSILVSIIINITGEAGSKSISLAITIILYILLFPFVENVKLKNIYIYICFGVIFLTQICYMFNIGFVINFVETYYPLTWGERLISYTNEHVTINNFTQHRLGGLYRNPNQCAKYITFLLAIFFVNNREKNLSKQILFITLCIMGIIFTGSRTGFVVASLLVIFALWSNGRMTNTIKFFLIVGTVAYIVYSIIQGGTSRALNIQDGMNDSLLLKFNLVIYYLQNEYSAISWLFGHLDMSLFQSPHSYSLDCEYGYIIYCYGFVGLSFFIMYFIKLFKHIDKKNRFFFICLLWMITSSIYMSYRTSFVFMLLASTIYQRKMDRIN